MPRQFQVECVSCDGMTPDDARGIASVLHATWPNDVPNVEQKAQQILDFGHAYHGPPQQSPRCFVIRNGQRLIATAGVFARTIQANSQPLCVMALTGVAVLEELRGQGYGRAVVQPAFELVDQGFAPWCLFQTGQHTTAFYQQFGARKVSNRFVNSKSDQPEANPWWEPAAMIYPDRTDWPDGTIDLLGPAY